MRDRGDRWYQGDQGEEKGGEVTTSILEVHVEYANTGIREYRFLYSSTPVFDGPFLLLSTTGHIVVTLSNACSLRK